MYNLGSIASEWAMDDPVKAAARLQQLPSNMQAGAIASVAQIWAGKDSHAAMEWARALTDPQPTQHRPRCHRRGHRRPGSGRRPRLARLPACRRPPRRARRGFPHPARSRLRCSPRQGDVPAGSRRSESRPQTHRRRRKRYSFGDSYGDPFGRYHDVDSGQLAALLEQLPPGAMRTNALNRLGSQLAGCTRDEADAILADYPAKEREKLQSTMLDNLTYQDPARALEIYQSLPATKVESYRLQNIISHLAQKDPEAALKISLESTSSQQQQQGVAAVFSQFALTDPDAARQRLSSIPPGPMYDSALSSIASAWGQTDATAALAWVDTLNGEQHTRALNALIPSLASSDPKTAADIIGEMLATSKDDNIGSISNAAYHLGQTWVQDDPAGRRQMDRRIARWQRENQRHQFHDVRLDPRRLRGSHPVDRYPARRQGPRLRRAGHRQRHQRHRFPHRLRMGQHHQRRRTNGPTCSPTSFPTGNNRTPTKPAPQSIKRRSNRQGARAPAQTVRMISRRIRITRAGGLFDRIILRQNH